MLLSLALGARAGRAADQLGAPPSAAECLGAYAVVDGWVRAWSVPNEPQLIDPPGTGGACVTLRLSGASGRLLSRVAVFTGAESAGRTLWLAASRARAEADRRLPLENDASREERRAELTGRLLVDIQIAGEPVALVGDSLDEIVGAFNPGRDGVLARVVGDSGERAEGYFPGSQLSLNLNPGKALESVIGALKIPPIPLAEQRSRYGLRLYRFEARHLAQTVAGESPEFLFRGGRVVPRDEMNGAGLRGFAGAMADHLVSHQWRGQEAYGLKGSYNPLTDTYTPPVASPREQAVVALALARYVRTPGADPTIAERSASASRAIVEKLTRVQNPEPDPCARASDAAAWLLADAELNLLPGAVPDDALAAFRTRAKASAWSAFKNEGDTGAWDDSITPGERAIISAAMAVTSADDHEREPARRAVRALFRETPSNELVGLLPWVGWAELALSPAESGAPVPASEALRQCRATCWQFQLQGDENAGASPDFAGGLVFSRSGPALPTWQTLRPLAFLATMLGDPRLTDEGELRPELSRLVLSARFARQLAVDGHVAHMFRDPSRGLGGVRLSCWDQTVSVDATSLALLGVCELLRSVDRRGP